MNQKKTFKHCFFLFLENPFPDQLVSLSQQPFRSLESFAPSRNVIPKKSIEELKDLCRICQMFTSEKPLECKTHCAKILNDKTSATKILKGKTSATKSGKNGLCITRRNTLSISTYNSCFIFFFLFQVPTLRKNQHWEMLCVPFARNTRYIEYQTYARKNYVLNKRMALI